MKFDITFVANAICNKYNNDSEICLEKHVPLDINLTKEEAANFIFRFCPNTFDIKDGYKVVMKYNSFNKLIGIALLKDDLIFVIVNLNMFLSQVVEGYIRTRTTEKITAMMEFDFEAFNESSDEFVDELIAENNPEE